MVFFDHRAFWAMKIEIIRHKGLNLDGTFRDDHQGLKGSVNIKGGVRQSGGHQKDTPTNRRSGVWLTVSTPIIKGISTTVKFTFNDTAERDLFKKSGEVKAFL